MIGYIVQHSHHGLGKVVDVNSQLVRVRFCESGAEMNFSLRSVKEGALLRARVGLGSRCIGPKGECVVSRIEQRAEDHKPNLYRITYNDSTSEVIPETAIIPLGGDVVNDPILLLAGLEPQSHSIFRSREQLVDAFSRTLREGSGLRALLSSRIDLRPHQAYVAGVVMLDLSRRYILADEVGLGKTIEAGIVIHDLICQKPDARILIVCPGALTQQWLCEIYAKFGGQVFTLLDLYTPEQIKLKELQKVIISTTLAAYSLVPVLESIPWDMVVVDEAHHLLASPVLYKFIQQLSRSTPSLLLLSAIPAQRREDEFLRLLALLEPDRYTPEDEGAQEHFRSLYAAQRDIGRRLRRFARRIDELDSSESSQGEAVNMALKLLELPLLDRDERLRGMIAALNLGSDSLAADLQEILHYVADRYRINRRILRNRRRRLIEQEQIQEIERKFMPHPYQPEQLEIETVDAVEMLLVTARDQGIPSDIFIPFARLLYQSTVVPSSVCEFLEKLVSAKPAQLNAKGVELLATGHMTGYTDWKTYCDLMCRAVRSFIPMSVFEQTLQRALAWKNSRRGLARWGTLLRFLKAKAQAKPFPKIIVFAGYPGAAREIAEQLRKEFGDRAVKEFRHDLLREEKEQNVYQFQTNPATWLLVSDETGGEGRNFQFADELIHFDNPWYASRIEQRIGRLDRIGRERVRLDVVSNVFFNEASVEAGLVHCYHEGLNVYTQSISGLEFALRNIEERLVKLALEGGRDILIDYATELRNLAEQERAHDESESILDEASFERATADKYRRVLQSHESEKELEQAFVNYFRKISSGNAVKAVHDNTFPQGIWRFSPDQTRYGPLPIGEKKREDLLAERKGTFLRHIAQQRPDLNFFNIGNPLFDAVIESLNLHPTGRVYAIDCTIRGRNPWKGFEFVFYATPDLRVIDKYYGLMNQAREIFTARPIHLFYKYDGAYEEDAQWLLELRHSLRRDNKGSTWQNLTKERAQLLQLTVGDRDWQQLVIELQEDAKIKAHELFQRRLERELEPGKKRLAELMRQERQQNIFSDNGETIALTLLLKAISDWRVELDSLGFLAVNENLLGAM